MVFKIIFDIQLLCKKILLFAGKELSHYCMQTNQLDQTDIDILRLLQKDARLSNKQLSAMLHKSISSVFQRVNRLKEQGFILGSFTLINQKKFADIWLSFTQVQLSDHRGEAINAFQTAVIQFTEVLECYNTTGTCDFMLKIAVNDMTEYNRFIVEKLTKLPNVGSLQSFFVVNEAKRELVYPLKSKS
ncbi:transcriptional regulator, AsnC family [Pedobacter africanus]|uniref:Transcriptional regulator, AsnC family n=2 Tax=Pedobacter africanus TaxID=151894 RepID=A0A1W2DAR7_9SPHI|nr:transcriptional regulator, AsnC family [Pedobacter africanus]